MTNEERTAVNNALCELVDYIVTGDLSTRSAFLRLFEFRHNELLRKVVNGDKPKTMKPRAIGFIA